MLAAVDEPEACQLEWLREQVTLSGSIELIHDSDNSQVWRFTHGNDLASTLPSSIVVKVHAEESWLQTELIAYQKLEQNGAKCIPRCYGEMEIVSGRARARCLGVQEIDGRNIPELLSLGLKVDDALFENIRECFTTVANCGICPQDDNPANFIVPSTASGPRLSLVMLDFAWADHSMDKELCRRRNKSDAESVIWKIRMACGLPDDS